MTKFNWKKWLGVIGGIILLFMMAFVTFKACNNAETKKAETAEAKVAPVVDPCAEKLKAALARADSLQAALDICCPKPKVLTVEEKLAIVERELAALKRAPRSYNSKPKDVSPTEDVVEKSFTGNNFKPKNTTVTEETFPADNTSLPITQYEGGFSGAYCLTINDDGYLVYGIKNAPNITQAPLLNSENGPAMTLDNASGYWFYIDYNRLVSVQEINTWNYAMEWNVYIGQTNYGTGSYPTYLPHQSLKPLINKVRGKEWGEITDDDLMQMRKENPDIWTPSSEGTLRPFRLDATNGRAYGKEDKNLYQGWNFRTKIYAKKRTTIGYYVPKFKNYYLKQKVNMLKENFC
jgi:hypothetical protein